MKSFLSILVLSATLTLAHSETLPAPPTKFFDDRVGAIPPNEAARLNEKLAAIEKDNPKHPQFIVTVLPFDSASSLEDYTNRVAKSWHIGQKTTNNGLILFWFPATHKLRFEVGYGLEAYLPDLRCKRILSDQIVPSFKQKNFVGGLNAGIDEAAKYLASPPDSAANSIATAGGFDAGAKIVLLIFVIGVGGFGLIVAARSFFRTKEPDDEPIQKDFSETVSPFPPVSQFSQLHRATRVPADGRKPMPRARIIPVPVPIVLPAKKKKVEEPAKEEESSGSFGGFSGGFGSSDSGSSFDSGSSSSGSDFGGGGGGDFGGGGASSDY